MKSHFYDICRYLYSKARYFLTGPMFKNMYIVLGPPSSGDRT